MPGAPDVIGLGPVPIPTTRMEWAKFILSIGLACAALYGAIDARLRSIEISVAVMGADLHALKEAKR